MKIILAVNDMFFASKIRGLATLGDISLNSAGQTEQVLEMARRDRPDLVIFDLSDARSHPLETIRQMKADPLLAGIKTIGFFSHVQIEIQQQAKEAGCDLVIAKSSFSRMLPQLLSECRVIEGTRSGTE